MSMSKVIYRPPDTLEPMLKAHCCTEVQILMHIFSGSGSTGRLIFALVYSVYMTIVNDRFRIMIITGKYKPSRRPSRDVLH